jgi:hypothetical protein
MLRKAKTKGPTLERVRIVKRRQKRQQRRVLESVAGDWVRWDQACAVEGLNWSEFTRRALEARAALVLATVKPVRRPAGVRK